LFLLNMFAICVSMCSLSPSLSVLFVDADRRYSGVDLHSHTHSLSLSVSPLPCLSLFHLKGAATPKSGSIETQISLYSVLVISKVAPTRKYRYAECRYAECHYAECHYAECRYAECCYAGCRYAECHYAECRQAECHGASKTLAYYGIYPFIVLYESIMFCSNKRECLHILACST